MTDLDAERERRLRRRRVHERQAVVFGTLLTGLAVAGLGSVAVYTGAVSAPFLQREFSSPEPEDTGTAVPPAPCPPEGTLPVAPASVQVNVLNGADRPGLAGETSSELTARGFTVLSSGNYPATLPEPARLVFGELGIAGAYTLAHQLDLPVMVMDTRQDATVDLVLGESYTALLDAGSVVVDPALPLVGVAGCVPLEEARANALPAAVPTPAATPTPTEPAPEG